MYKKLFQIIPIIQSIWIVVVSRSVPVIAVASIFVFYDLANKSLTGEVSTVISVLETQGLEAEHKRLA